jgi:NADPH:quinone reductase-like Zn-dependent oxidoreductase
MRAAVHTSYGPPEVVRIAEVDKPTATGNQVLVKVHATTVDRTDCGFRAGKPFIVRFITGLIRPKVTVLGNEFAGEVEAVGAGVTSLAVGDRVCGYSGLQHGSRFGAHAEYLVMSEDGSLATMPANLSYEQAAPSTEGAHYALTMIRTAKIQQGYDVLVYGATGAIGSAAVQLLKSLGAQVIGVCGIEHLELVGGLGADRVMDYTAEDFTRDEQRYEVVLDAVGKSSFFRCRRLLRPGGSYLSSDGGPLTQNLVQVLITPLVGVVGGKCQLCPSRTRTPASMRESMRDRTSWYRVRADRHGDRRVARCYPLPGSAPSPVARGTYEGGPAWSRLLRAA